MKDQFDVKITLRGSTYSIGSSQYRVDGSGEVLVGKLIVGDEEKQNIVNMAMRMAVKQVAEDLAKDIAAQAKKVFSTEIGQATNEYLKANKDRLIAIATKQAAKDAERAVEDLYDRY